MTAEGKAWAEGAKAGWKVVDTSDPEQKKYVQSQFVTWFCSSVLQETYIPS